jgi:hypothetical protein
MSVDPIAYERSMNLRHLSAHCDICIRKLRRFLKDPNHPLPHFKVDGTILVNIGEFKAWLEEHFRVKGRDIDRIIDEVLEGF